MKVYQLSKKWDVAKPFSLQIVSIIFPTLKEKLIFIKNSQFQSSFSGFAIDRCFKIIITFWIPVRFWLLVLPKNLKSSHFSCFFNSMLQIFNKNLYLKKDWNSTTKISIFNRSTSDLKNENTFIQNHKNHERTMVLWVFSWQGRNSFVPKAPFHYPLRKGTLGTNGLTADVAGSHPETKVLHAYPMCPISVTH